MSMDVIGFTSTPVGGGQSPKTLLYACFESLQLSVQPDPRWLSMCVS
jgi:hypothetical protein